MRVWTDCFRRLRSSAVLRSGTGASLPEAGRSGLLGPGNPDFLFFAPAGGRGVHPGLHRKTEIISRRCAPYEYDKNSQHGKDCCRRDGGMVSPHIGHYESDAVFRIENGNAVRFLRLPRRRRPLEILLRPRLSNRLLSVFCHALFSSFFPVCGIYCS